MRIFAYTVLLLICSINLTFAQDESDYADYIEQQRALDIHIGMGTGAKYGGWGGASGEIVFGGYFGIMAGTGFLFPNKFRHRPKVSGTRIEL